MKQGDMFQAASRPAEESVPFRDLLSLAELACLAGATPQMISDLLEWDLVAPCERDPEPWFAMEILPQVRKAVRLHRDLGVSFCSMGLVLDLLERIEELERRQDSSLK
ncbi:MAG: chaperone modulator CbpM [Verrucomicrobia bacterium]|nr:chaperone modulator CbpM [Verrucomicrobiota bacterium]MBU1734067.1 chaperone modulator CbpM [Verrucomicrobiota bacterium]MBU1855723.1 chaperone modulator CbpM [Verrucomicrobiota bacterium]